MTASKAHPYPGTFITFEGLDGAGKSTHLSFVQDWLSVRLMALNKKLTVTREPGGAPLSEHLRELLLVEPMHAETEILLMFAARREHLARKIEPVLKDGNWLISDRFTDATYAYQGGGRQIPFAKIEALEQWVHPHLQPDLTFFFDVSEAVAAERVRRARDLDRFEAESGDFFTRVREAYHQRASQFPQRFRIIDSSLPIEDIQSELVDLLEAFLKS
ncbi:dTMP kinase [Ampullimonas aquatilis]|uniref:dTMP kinase n=1 Tax=Ampullimonas aquatilis TaxID=1341549 RepID=UPI003C77036F